MKKVFLIIALACLSMGAFAQYSTFYTNVYFEKIPNYIPGKDKDVKVVVTWYLNTGATRTNYSTCGILTVNTTVSVSFPVDPGENAGELASKVTSTKVDLYFYNSSGGTSQTFPSFLAIATYGSSFTGNMWWKVTPNESSLGLSTGGYIITQSPTP